MNIYQSKLKCLISYNWIFARCTYAPLILLNILTYKQNSFKITIHIYDIIWIKIHSRE